MQVVYGDECDESTARRWTNRCKEGESGKSELCDKVRIGRPVTAIDKFHRGWVDELIKARIDFPSPSKIEGRSSLIVGRNVYSCLVIM